MRQILLAVEGQYSNVVYMMPPLCFTVENAEHLVRTLNSVLEEAEALGLDKIEKIEALEEESFFRTGLHFYENEESVDQYEDMD